MLTHFFRSSYKWLTNRKKHSGTNNAIMLVEKTDNPKIKVFIPTYIGLRVFEKTPSLMRNVDFSSFKGVLYYLNDFLVLPIKINPGSETTKPIRLNGKCIRLRFGREKYKKSIVINK